MATLTLTAGARVRVTESWMSSSVADDNHDRIYEEHLSEEWEDDLADDPEALAAIERRLDMIDAEMAAGTWVGSSTEEVFARLDKKYPILREFDDD